MRTVEIGAFTTLSVITGVLMFAALPAKTQQQVISYQCLQGNSFQAQFSPESARIRLNQNEILTLSQVPSGSGVQYTDGRTTLYTQGNEALIEVNNVVVFEQCVAADLAEVTTPPNPTPVGALW